MSMMLPTGPSLFCVCSCGGLATGIVTQRDSVRSLPKSVDETADKLDGMMDIVFAYMGRYVVCSLGGFQRRSDQSHVVRSRLAAGEVAYLVQVLLRAFHSSLLQTYKSKFTQVRTRL